MTDFVLHEEAVIVFMNFSEFYALSDIRSILGISFPLDRLINNFISGFAF